MREDRKEAVMRSPNEEVTKAAPNFKGSVIILRRKDSECVGRGFIHSFFVDGDNILFQVVINGFTKPEYQKWEIGYLLPTVYEAKVVTSPKDGLKLRFEFKEEEVVIHLRDSNSGVMVPHDEMAKVIKFHPVTAK